MQTEPLPRFRFDLRELMAPGPSRPALVPAPDLEPLPAGAAPIGADRRPLGMAELLPVFPAARPLRVAFEGAASPALDVRLRDELATILATAGAASGVAVVRWGDGLAAGRSPLEQIPRRAHVHLVSCEPWPGSVAVAARLLRTLPSRRALLVLNGRSRKLDRSLGLALPAAGLGSVSLPRLSSGELAGGVRNRAWSRACRALARAVVAAYREQEP